MLCFFVRDRCFSGEWWCRCKSRNKAVLQQKSRLVIRVSGSKDRRLKNRRIKCQPSPSSSHRIIIGNAFLIPKNRLTVWMRFMPLQTTTHAFPSQQLSITSIHFLSIIYASCRSAAAVGPDKGL